MIADFVQKVLELAFADKNEGLGQVIDTPHVVAAVKVSAKIWKGR